MKNFEAIICLLAAMVLAVTSGNVRGADCVWEGQGTGDTTDWFNASNWQGGVPPAGRDVVVVTVAKANIVLTNTPPALASFTISASSAANTATLTFTNWFTALVADEINVNAYGKLTCAGPYTNAPAMSNRVWVICSNLTVAANGKIDVDGRGYAGGIAAGKSGSGPGAGIYGGWQMNTAGYGGHGGTIFGRGGEGGVVYGSAEWPEQPGSGGQGTASTDIAVGGAGGGAVRIDASDTVTIHGMLSARGQNGSGYAADGSGGGILVTSRVIRGSGSILADGANARSGDASGGGRIALHYHSVDQQALAVRPTLTISAASGSLLASHFSICGFGSLWFSDRSFLGVNSVANIRGWLHIAGFTNWCVPALALTNAFVGFTEPGFTLEVTNDVKVSGNGAIAFTNGASVTIGGDCRVGVQLARGGRLTVAGDLTPPKMTTDNYQCRFNESDVLVGGDLVISNTWMFASAPSNGLEVCGSLLEAGGLMSFGGASTLFLASNPTNGGAPLLRSRDFVLSAGTTIDTIGRGFGGGPLGLSGHGYGYGGGKCLSNGGGGGYGGRGGGTEASYGISNGLAYAPLHPGSGGGAYRTYAHPGGAGGGLVHIEATNSATINGSILANGGAPNYSGSGSGGGIFIRTRRFTGGAAAILRANGGNIGTGKRGGGGRICVWYDEMPETMAELLLSGRHAEIGSRLLATTTFPGYEGAAEALAGFAGVDGEEDGTVFFVRILPPAGTVMLLR